MKEKKYLRVGYITHKNGMEKFSIGRKNYLKENNTTRFISKEEYKFIVPWQLL